MVEWYWHNTTVVVNVCFSKLKVSVHYVVALHLGHRLLYYIKGYMGWCSQSKNYTQNTSVECESSNFPYIKLAYVG